MRIVMRSSMAAQLGVSRNTVDVCRNWTVYIATPVGLVPPSSHKSQEIGSRQNNFGLCWVVRSLDIEAFNHSAESEETGRSMPRCRELCEVAVHARQDLGPVNLIPKIQFDG